MWLWPRLIKKSDRSRFIKNKISFQLIVFFISVYKTYGDTVLREVMSTMLGTKYQMDFSVGHLLDAITRENKPLDKQ